jgi:hypothetical protein
MTFVSIQPVKIILKDQDLSLHFSILHFPNATTSYMLC